MTNKLAGIFYTMPDVATQTVTRKELRKILLDTRGSILSCGRLRAIKPKHLGAGIYNVTLEVLEK